MKPSGGSDQSTSNSAVRDQSVSFDAINAGPMVKSLDADMSSTQAIITAEERAAHQQQFIHDTAKNKRRMVKYAVLGILLLTALGVAALRHGSGNQALNSQADASQRFPATSIPLASLSTNSPALAVGNAKTLSVNGQLNVNNSIVITPTTQPSGAVTGQLYYNQSSNQLAYYDGKSFQSILSGNDVVTTSLGGASGALNTGSGLSVTGKTLSNTGVLTVGGASGNIAAGKGVSVRGGAINNTGVLTLQGESGDVTLAAGNGIVVNGTTLSNSGLLSLGGQHGDIAVGTGLAIDSGTLHNTGIISATGAGLITVTNDGNGNITIDGPTGGGTGSGTVASPGGTIDKLAKFTGVQTIADSIISDDGTTVTIGGNLSVSGAVTFSSPLTVANGGTGATTANGARTNLGAAGSGNNTDITQLSGLTTALSVAQGGTGIGTLPTNGVLVGNGSSAISGVTAAGSGLCLVSTAGAPTFQACPGSGGVASVNSLTGALSLTGISAGSITSGGSTITINDATSAVKGLASFNATDLKVTGGNVDTVQGISTTATPTFGQLMLTSSQATGTMLDINNTNAGATGNLLNLSLNGSSKLSVSPAGNLTLTGAVNGQTIGSASSFTGGVSVSGALTVNTISPTSALTVGVGSQAFTLQGNNSSVLKATNGTSTTTVDFQSPSANVTYNFATAVAGNYDICTTVGNCAGVGGGVTTLGGTTNTLAKFTGSGTVGNSIITDNGSTVTVGGTLSVNTLTPTGALTVGASSQNLTLQGAAVSLKDSSAGIANSLVFATPAGSNKTITLPNASGTIAVSASGPISLDASGNLTCPTCLTSGGSGGTAGVSSLNSQTGDITLQGTSANSISTVGTTITVNDATSAVKGLASFNATDLKVVSGNVDTVQSIAVSATPTFAGLNLSSALTVGNGGTGSTTAAGARTNLGAAASGANSDITSLSGLTTALSVLQGGTGAQSLTANGVLVGNGTSPVTSVTGSNGQCLMIVAGTPAFGACPGGGSSPVSSLDGLTGALTINNSTGSGAAITINNAAADGTTKGIAAFNGTDFQVTAGVVDTIQSIATSASPTFNGLTLSTALTVGNGGTGSTTAAGARTNLGAAASGANSDITKLTGLTTALSVSQGGTGLNALTANEILFANSTSSVSQLAIGTAGQCLESNGAGLAPSFQTCTGAGGVSSVDGLTGSITLDNSTGSLGHITIANAAADGTTKGIAAFNGTDLKATNGVVDTIQGIASSSTPSFAGLNLTAALTVGNGGTGSATASGARTNLGAAASGANSDITSLSGLTTALSVSQGGTGLNALSAFGILYASSTSAISQLGVGTSGQCLISNGAGVAASWQACPGAGSSGITGTGTSGKIALFNGTSTLTSSDITDTAGSSLSVGSGVSLTLQGSALFENASDSSTAFRVQDHLANNLLAIDTSGDNINIGATGTSALTTTINIGTSTGDPQSVAIGSTAGSSSTTLQGGSGGVLISASAGNAINIGTSNSDNITIGKFSGTNPIILQGNGISQTITGLTTNPASDIIKTSSNSITAFQVQNSNGYSILNVNTSSSLITFGNKTTSAGQGVAGSLALADGTNDNVLLTLNTATLGGSGYTLSLPSLGASAGSCLQSASGSTTSATTLTFGSCGGVSTTNLQQAYNTSAGASPDIDMTSANKGFTIQNDNASPITGELFGVHDKTASGLGSSLFSIANNGDITANSNETTSTGGAFTYNANTVSSGNGLVVNANGLTTGYGVNIATTSNLQTAGSLVNVSDTAQIQTSGSSITGSLVNVSRSLTANVTGSSGGPTLDNSTHFQESTGVTTPWSNSFTVGNNQNRYLIVTVAEGGACGPDLITYGGVQMNILGQTNPNYPYVFEYGLTAPATGANNLVISPTNTATCGGSSYFDVMVESWYNVNQSTPYGSFSSNYSWTANTNPSMTANSAAGRVVVDAVAAPSGTPVSITPTAGQTVVTSNVDNTSPNDVTVASSYKTAAGTTTTMGWTTTSDSSWQEVAIDLISASGSEGVTGAVATYSDSCAITAGTCGDSGSVLNINENFSGASGNAVNIQNSGTGSALNIVNNGNGTNYGASIMNTSPNTESTGGLYVGSTYGDGIFAYSGDNSAIATYTSNSSSSIYAESDGSGNGITGINYGTGHGVVGIATGASAGWFQAGASGIGAATIAAVQYQSSTDDLLHLDNSSFTPLFSVAYNGATTIGNGTATAVTINTASVTATASATNAVIKVGKMSNGDSIVAAGSVVTGAGDYAEYFTQAVPDAAQPGDVVCLNASSEVEDCGKSASDTLLGVISTAPGYVGNNTLADSQGTDKTALVSMLGQVPVHVSDAKGAIHVGDMLTYDPTTGLAVKATSASMTIGEALQDFSGGTGTIQLYIHIGYYDPMGLQSDGVSSGYVLQGASATLSALTVDGTATINTLNVTGSATIASLTVTTSLSTSGITVNGHIVTGGAAPTVTVGATAGTGASVNVSGNDTSGKVTFTLGTSAATGELVVVTFSQAYGAAPNVVLTAGDSNAAKIQQFVTPTKTGFSVNAATSNGLTTGQTYTLYYHVMQ